MMVYTNLTQWSQKNKEGMKLVGDCGEVLRRVGKVEWG